MRHHHQLHKVAHMQAVRCRIEPDVEGYRSPPPSSSRIFSSLVICAIIPRACSSSNTFAISPTSFHMPICRAESKTPLRTGLSVRGQKKSFAVPPLLSAALTERPQRLRSSEVRRPSTPSRDNVRTRLSYCRRPAGSVRSSRRYFAPPTRRFTPASGSLRCQIGGTSSVQCLFRCP